jgi:hypothetical protein
MAILLNSLSLSLQKNSRYLPVNLEADRASCMLGDDDLSAPLIQTFGKPYRRSGPRNCSRWHYFGRFIRVTCEEFAGGTGELPKTLDQVQERVKDIQFQSKTRFSIAQIRAMEERRSTLARIGNQTGEGAPPLGKGQQHDAAVRGKPAATYSPPLPEATPTY